MISRLLFAVAVVLAVLKLAGVVSLGWGAIAIIGLTLTAIGLALIAVDFVIGGIAVLAGR